MAQQAALAQMVGFQSPSPGFKCWLDHLHPCDLGQGSSALRASVFPSAKWAQGLFAGTQYVLQE